jgi:putative membrane protein
VLTRTRGRGGGEGVRTRDHLAAVRTTLAWVRMGVVLMAAGYGLDKLALLEALNGHGSQPRSLGRPLGLLAVVAGMLMTVAALWRYLRARERIESDRFEARPPADLALIGAVAAGALVFAVALLVTR